MALPPLAPYPPSKIRAIIGSADWEALQDAWLVLTQKYLALPTKLFLVKLQDDPSLVNFLVTYFDSIAEIQDYASVTSQKLRKTCFLLVQRIYQEQDDPSPAMLDWRFLSNLSLVYPRSQSLREILNHTWLGHDLGSTASMRQGKTQLIEILENFTGSQTPPDLTRTVAFALVCHHYGQFLMLGSDLIDSIASSYDRCKAPLLKTRIMHLAKVSMTSLMNKEHPKTSALLDHLYSLQSTALLRGLIETTQFYNQLENLVAQSAVSSRITSLLKQLAIYKRPAKSKIPVRRKIDKGKYPAKAETSDDIVDGVHIHKMSLITQIQDLFPDLGSGFIVKLLDEYNEDTEQITAHLLEEDLPLHLRNADHSETLPPSASTHEYETQRGVADLAPNNTPPFLPVRRNIYDNDDFDQLTVDASKLHVGRKNQDLTTDHLLATERPSNQKAAILSALAAFDSDDDERDDTYDVEDVGGTIDTTFAGDDDADASTTDKIDELLYKTFRFSPETFSRDAGIRKSQARSALKQETALTDEAIEGWAIMLARDPQRRRRLERAHDLAGGGGGGGIFQQSALASTAWRADSGTEGTEDSDVGNVSRGGRGGGGGGRGRGRGQGRGRGGNRGGNVSGPASDRETQVARQRKDAHKASRANHNRRAQRAKKMARVGFPG